MTDLQHRTHVAANDVATQTWWFVVGPAGAVQLLLVEHHIEIPGLWEPGHLDAQDLGFHSPTPRGSAVLMRPCSVLDGDCYYLGSAWAARLLLETATADGWNEGRMWQALDTYYAETFGAQAVGGA